MIKEYEDGIKQELQEDHFTSAGQTISVISSRVTQQDSLEDNDCEQSITKKICLSVIDSCTTG